MERENDVFAVLQDFSKTNLEFVLVGGYAVSAFRHRFSVDADVVVRKKDLHQFVSTAEARGFEKSIFKTLHHHEAEFFQYKRKGKFPVTVDFMVNGLASRQSDSFWSFDYLYAHSKKMKITGIEKEVSLKVPERELLIALKINAGRETDMRDAVALIETADPQKIIGHFIEGGGNTSENKKVISSEKKILENANFENSFKGVFETKKFDETSMLKLKTVLIEIEEKLSD